MQVIDPLLVKLSVSYVDPAVPLGLEMDKDNSCVVQATGAATAVVDVVAGVVVVDTVGIVVWATVVLGAVVVDAAVVDVLVDGDAAGEEDPQAATASPSAAVRNVEPSTRRRRRKQ